MSSAKLMKKLAETIDAHEWGDLPGLLHPKFSCRYVHTNESFDRDAWVQLNANYPGFQNFVLEDCVADGDRAAGRAHVTGMTRGRVQHFEVAIFITLRDQLIAEMTEVWTGVEETAPEGTRPD